MKKERRLTIHFLQGSTSVNKDRNQEETGYSEDNPFYFSSSPTIVAKRKIDEQTRREYWPFLEPV
jgi:hypothetical protein